MHSEDQLFWLESGARELLRGSGIDFVATTYGGSRSGAEQERRIAERSNRPARRHVTCLTDEEMAATAQLSTPRRAPYGWSGAAV